MFEERVIRGMHYLSLNDKSNIERLSELLGGNRFSGKGKNGIPEATQFAAVFNRVEARLNTALSEPLSSEAIPVKEKRMRKTEIFEKEGIERPLQRQDMATAQNTTETPTRVDKPSEVESSHPKREVGEEVAVPGGEGQSPDSRQSKDKISGDLSGKRQGAVGIGPNANALSPGGKTGTDLISAPITNGLDISQSSLGKDHSLEDVSDSKEAGIVLLKENNTTMAQDVEESTADLKTVLMEKLLEKQAKVSAEPASQQLLEKQGLHSDLNPADSNPGANTGNTTSIVETLQGLTLSKSIGIEGGVSGGKTQGGMGQGGTFLGNSGFAQSTDFQPGEGSTAIQKTATEFRALMNAGRSIPDEGAVLRQVAQQLRAWRSGQDEPIRFLLEPKNLGQIQIDITLKDGGLTAHMVTSDVMVKELLERNQHFLQEALKEQGLEMQEFSVDLGDRKGFGADTKTTDDFNKLSLFSEEGRASVSIEGTSPGLRPGEGGLSLYV